MGISRLRVFVVLGALLLSGAAVEAREPTFEERVRAQEAIERVYYSYLIGTTRPFEEAVPHEVLERKVHAYLKKTVALEEFWKTWVTSDMLRRELERMAEQTRMPERLRQLYAVLGDDPILVQECLARPVLVDRLARNFFSYDTQIQSEARRRAEALREDLASGRLDPRSEYAGRTVTTIVRISPGGVRAPKTGPEAALGGNHNPSRLELAPDEFERYRAGLPKRAGDSGPVVEGRDGFSVRAILEVHDDDLRVASVFVPKLDWEEWWRSVEGRLDERSVHAAIPPLGPLPIPRDEPSEILQNSTCLAD